MTWTDTGLPWVPPSPNMPHLSTLAHYPGACLVEGTQLSEGRGTTLPFEIVGAPWIDPLALAGQLNGEAWAGGDGRAFPPAHLPTLSEQMGRADLPRCAGLYHRSGALAADRSLAGRDHDHSRHVSRLHFAWLPANPETGLQHFDRLIGAAWMRRQIESDVPPG